ncbi:CTSB [Cordylochernes scorpioides]|uniref:CTSB n=1 Tax=Cordylochernes scorpioides TaxID=51811 RepID=A0ABY6K7L9_9ARAC|nr:CTSB [Cordylochernes scorpioides]
MKCLLVLAALLTLSWGFPTQDQFHHPLSDSYIEWLNSRNSTWKAGRNFDRRISLDYVKQLCGTILEDDHEDDLPTIVHETEEVEIPESYDVREAWSQCKSVHLIRDQGSCGSCWAHGAVEAISDRICIASKGEVQVEISASDLVSCCPMWWCGLGCKGGWIKRAWQYWKHRGLVTGGLYHGEGCVPYAISPCSHHSKNSKLPPCGALQPTPPCLKQCVDGYNSTYAQDKHYGKDLPHLHYFNRRTFVLENKRFEFLEKRNLSLIVFKSQNNIFRTIKLKTCENPPTNVQIFHHMIGNKDTQPHLCVTPGKRVYKVKRNPEQIQLEIMNHGPVTAAMVVYSDFPSYKSGVYQRHSYIPLGGHAIKILGWGVENGVKYWLCANSWNQDWGDKGKFSLDFLNITSYYIDVHMHLRCILI